MTVMYVNVSYNISGLGRMIDTNCFFARVNAGGSGGARAFKNSVIALDTTTDGVTLGNVGAGTAAQADASCSWHTSTGDVPTVSSDAWVFGANCSSGLYAVYHTGAPDSFDSTHGTTFTAKFGTGGGIHAYGTYFILEHYVKRGGVMTKAFRYVKRGGVMTGPVKRYVRQSGTWTQVAQFTEAPFDPVHAQPVWERDENGIWIPGIVTWEGPIYIGSPGAREFHLHGEKALRSRPYELVAVA